MALFINSDITLNDVIQGIWEGKSFEYTASNNHQPEAGGYFGDLNTYEHVHLFLEHIENSDFYDIELKEVTA